tara:strand:+ start:1494 stop:2678 length:1185 start_codon:yes stop_codon:yes gene_type:complete
MSISAKNFYSDQLSETKKEGLYKQERIIESCQSSVVSVHDKEVVNLCSNNYLGLSSHSDIIDAAKSTLDSHGFGMSSVRFICGTQDIHKDLEGIISKFLHKEDTILYAAAFDANGGLFEPLLTSDDAIISDELNHASIIDGIRLCKAARFRYRNSDMKDLELKLKETKDYRFKLIVTDGVFSMDGSIAKLDKICVLAKKYNALVMVDDCHATGFLGETGRGSAEYHNVLDQVDIITGTLGKAMGGAMGGFTSSSKEVIDILRQKSRPYLFSNSLAPCIVGASIKAFKLLNQSDYLRKKLFQNTNYFRTEMVKIGFDLLPGEHPIIPIMLYDAEIAQEFSKQLLEKGVYAVGFFYPVVPQKLARIRVQLSAAHTIKQLDFALNAFLEVGKNLRLI